MKKIPKKFIVLAILLLVFGIMDAGFTTWLISNELAYELNPVMNWLLELGYGWFWGVKITITGLAAWYLAKHHKRKTARVGLWATTIIYGLLILYYIVGFIIALCTGII